MGQRTPIDPVHAAAGSLALFAMAALFAWTGFFSVGGWRTVEATLVGCDSAIGNQRTLELTLDRAPYSARLQGDDVPWSEVESLCAQDTRVRVVVRERSTLSGDIHWVKGLVRLDDGAVLVDEEEERRSTRRSDLGQAVLVLLSSGLGLLLLVLGVRDGLANRARRARRKSSLPPEGSRSQPAAPPARRERPLARGRSPVAPARGKGALLFQRRNDLDHFITALLLAAALGAGAFLLLRPPKPAWIEGLGVSLLTLLPALGAWVLRPARLVVHQAAITLHRWPLPPVTLRDDEAVSLAFASTEHSAYGIAVGTVTALTVRAADRKFIDFRCSRRRPDEDLRALFDRLVPQVTERLWAELQAGHEVPWGTAFLGPGWVRVGKGGSAERIPISELDFRSSDDRVVGVDAEGVVLVSIPIGAVNFLPGILLIRRMRDGEESASA